MNRIFLGVVCLLIFSGCSHKNQSALGKSAFDLVQPGQEINWAEGFVLSLTNREGSSVSGVTIIRTSIAGVPTTVNAEKGEIFKGKDENSVKMTVYNAEIWNGKTQFHANKMDFEFSK